MKFALEKELRDFIIEKKDSIHNYGFECLLNSTVQKEYILPSGKKIDIISRTRHDDELLLNIIELKKDNISYTNGLIQAYEYAAELVEAIFIATPIISISLKVILVGYAIEGMPILKFFILQPDIYSYDIKIDSGLKFTQHTEGGFVINKNYSIDKMLSEIINQ